MLLFPSPTCLSIQQLRAHFCINFLRSKNLLRKSHFQQVPCVVGARRVIKAALHTRPLRRYVNFQRSRLYAPRLIEPYFSGG
jgi:hypothetical protein